MGNVMRLASVCIGAVIGLVLCVVVGVYYRSAGLLVEIAAMVSVFVVSVALCYCLGSLAQWWLAHRAGGGGGGGGGKRP